MAFAGAVGGLISLGVIYPLDTVKTRIQTEVKKTPSATDALLPGSGAPRKVKATGVRQMVLKIFREQGVAGLYRGFGASMLNTFAMQFAYFYWYTIVRRTYVKRFPLAPHASLNTLTELALGALAAAFAQLFTIPVSVIATRQQLSDTHSSVVDTFRSILADDGVTGLWRGLKPSLVLTINPAITYGMFERLKTALLKEGEKMTPGKAFVIGALSKTMATVVTYPYIMAKTRLQAKYTVEDDSEPELADVSSSAPVAPKKKEKYSGAVDVLRQTYGEKGFAGWYQGMQAQITKAVLSQALLFGIKDALEAYVLVAVIMIAQRRGKQ